MSRPQIIVLCSTLVALLSASILAVQERGAGQGRAAAFAQAIITGTVKDASGAVLPGVTVEASSLLDDAAI